MSTFSGLNSAYTALVAARTAIEVTGQNIANATTDGYTRQRVTQTSISALTQSSLVSTSLATVGQGVLVTSVDRLNDSFLESRVRTTASAAAYSTVRASALSSLETTLNEPSDDGIAAQLSTFWSSWQDLANSPDTEATASVVIEEAGALVTQIAQGYTEVASQWEALRSDTDVLAESLNDAASQVADLNGLIRSTLNSGGSVNELLDQRAVLLTTISSIAGGTVTERSDGTVDVLIGGNPLVSGTTTHAVAITGSESITDGVAVQLEWTERPGSAIPLEGGELTGTLSLLAAADSSGTGGELSEAAASYNALATALATQVNAIHSTGQTTAGTTGLDFFALSTTAPAALGLTVVPTQSSEIATGAVDGGALDGSVADAISQISEVDDSPDGLWGDLVTTLAVATKSELQQSTLTDLAASSALSAQQSSSSVDLDEENVNLLLSQTAYQAAARVFTAIDEMLDTLINNTGLVGR